jgi:tetratricopeptide (TPR) repeat protein
VTFVRVIASLSFLLIFSVGVATAQESKDQKKEKAAKLCVEGESLYQAGHKAEALAKFKEAIDTYIKSVEAHSRYQDIMREMGEGEKLSKMYKEFLDLAPNSAEFNYLYGRIQKDLDEEVKCYKKAIELKPDFFPAHFALGFAYLCGKQYDLALKEYEKCLEIDSKNVAVLIRLADVYEKTAQFEKQRECYKKAAEIEPTSPIPLYLLGKSYAYEGKHKEAIGLFEKADSMGLAEPEFIVEYAQTYAAIGEKLKSIEIFARLFSANLKVEDFRKVERHVLAMFDPYAKLTNENDRKTLAKSMEFIQGDAPDPEKALTCLSELAKKVPECEAVQFHLGLAYFAAGKLEEAKATLEKAVQLAPHYFGAHHYLAYIAHLQNRNSDALELVSKALKLNPFNSETNKLAVFLNFEKDDYGKTLFYAKRYIQLTGSAEDLTNIVYLSELYQQDERLFLEEFDESGFKVRLYKGIPPANPVQYILFKCTVLKEGKCQRIILVSGRDVPEPESETGERAIYYFLEEIERTDKEVKRISYKTYGKTAPEQKVFKEDVKKILKGEMKLEGPK